ncbi:MAG: hypothetical protein ABIZ72_06865, partial [Candidatus Limnocylindrales bacterium]
SHILGEVQQLADVLGIIAGGRLVREGPIAEMLEGEGVIRVRVAAGELPAARRILDGVAGPDQTVAVDDLGWLTLSMAPDRAAEVNRSLATAGIYASGLETGNDLESLFLTLTAGEGRGNHEGTFFGAAGSTPVVPPGWGQPPAGTPPAPEGQA